MPSWNESLRTWIATHRDNRLLSALGRVSGKYLRAYDNQAQWNVDTNGEVFALGGVTAIAPGDIFDVGANAGHWTEMAARVAPGRKIHSFELSPATFEHLQRTLSAIPSATANRFGLSDIEGEVTFHYYPDSTDRSSLFQVPDGFVTVKAAGVVRRGDRYAAESGVDQIAYLKIDVEGAEMNVLRGFEGMLQRRSIAAVQFEHGPAHAVTRHLLIDFIEFFREYDYETCLMFPRRIAPLRYEAARHENFTGANYLAIRRDVADRLHF